MNNFYIRIIVLITLICFSWLESECPAAQQENGGTENVNNSSSETRDPFWPVGFVPEGKKEPVEKKEPVAPVVEGGWSEAMNNVVINGVSSRADGDYYAVINREIKTVGQTVEVNYGGRTYTWTVDSIKPPGSVKLRRKSVR